MTDVPAKPLPSPLISVAKGVRTKSKLVSLSHFSWLWVVFSLILFVGDGVLMIFLGLDLVGIGLSNPIALTIWHFVLAIGFGIVTVVGAIYFTKEELLEDRLRLPIMAGLWTLRNAVATVLFLAWIIDHPSLYTDVQFKDNPPAYASFVALNGVSFLWFWVNIVAMVIAWLIHYNQRKYLETLNRTLQVTDFILGHYHGITLNAMMIAISGTEREGTTEEKPLVLEHEIEAHVVPSSVSSSSSSFSNRDTAWNRTESMLGMKKQGVSNQSTLISRADPVRGSRYTTRPPTKIRTGKR